MSCTSATGSRLHRRRNQRCCRPGADDAAVPGADGAADPGADGAADPGADGIASGTDRAIEPDTDRIADRGADGATDLGANGAAFPGTDGAALAGADGAAEPDATRRLPGQLGRHSPCQRRRSCRTPAPTAQLDSGADCAANAGADGAARAVADGAAGPGADGATNPGVPTGLPSPPPTAQPTAVPTAAPRHRRCPSHPTTSGPLLGHARAVALAHDRAPARAHARVQRVARGSVLAHRVFGVCHLGGRRHPPVELAPDRPVQPHVLLDPVRHALARRAPGQPREPGERYTFALAATDESFRTTRREQHHGSHEPPARERQLCRPSATRHRAVDAFPFLRIRLDRPGGPEPDVLVQLCRQYRSRGKRRTRHRAECEQHAPHGHQPDRDRHHHRLAGREARSSRPAPSPPASKTSPHRGERARHRDDDCHRPDRSTAAAARPCRCSPCAETLNSGTNTTNATRARTDARRTLIELTLDATTGVAPASHEAVTSRAATLGLIADAPDEMDEAMLRAAVAIASSVANSSEGLWVHSRRRARVARERHVFGD